MRSWRNSAAACAGRARRSAAARRRPPSAAVAGSPSRPASSGYRPLTTTGPRLTPDPVLEGEGGVDELVDRRLLGQRHEHDLRARGVGEHLEHVAGLGVDGPDGHGVEQALAPTAGR